MPTFAICILIGSAMGLLAGLIGVGGGIIAVPAMVYFLGIEPKIAMATSLAVIIPVSISGTVKHLTAGRVDMKVAVPIAIGGVLFAFLGAWLQQQKWMDESWLKRGFAVFILCVGLKMLLEKPKEADAPENSPAAPAQDRPAEK